jgi:hypothetical protein
MVRLTLIPTEFSGVRPVAIPKRVATPDNAGPEACPLPEDRIKIKLAYIIGGNNYGPAKR